jgi:multiple sugar transport system substrate-binding protein
MRNWPYAYALGQDNPDIKGKFEVVPFPEWEGGGTAGILGGHNLVISAFSSNPKGAMVAIDYLTSPETIKVNAAEFSLAPTLVETYDDPDVQKALPFASELKQAVEQAKSRPVSPVYTQISQAIYKNVNAALSGQMTPEEAVKTADSDINQALQTF